jgi:cyclopropane fatty-acyl-phospholipid synthase-like methyltransferase
VTALAPAWRAWRSYAGAPIGARAFLVARLLNAPLAGLDPELRALRGRVLSLGSGHGLLERYLVEVNPDVVVEGLELDAERVAIANRTAPPGSRVSLRCADVREFDGAARYDAVMAVDVMHHLPFDDHAGIAEALARCIRPGGVCLIKDIADRPVWKYRFNALHDRLVARDEVYCRSPESMAGVFEAAGLRVRDVRRLGPLSPYPHYLVVLEQPA